MVAGSEEQRSAGELIPIRQLQRVARHYRGLRIGILHVLNAEVVAVGDVEIRMYGGHALQRLVVKIRVEHCSHALRMGIALHRENETAPGLPLRVEHALRARRKRGGRTGRTVLNPVIILACRSSALPITDCATQAPGV